MWSFGRPEQASMKGYLCNHESIEIPGAAMYGIESLQGEVGNKGAEKWECVP